MAVTACLLCGRFCSLIGFTEEEVVKAIVRESRQFDEVKKICRQVSTFHTGTFLPFEEYPPPYCKQCS